MLNILTEKYTAAIAFLNIRYLYEIRLRAGKPVVVNYRGRYVYLCDVGVSDRAQSALTCLYADIEEIIYRASEFSVYSVTEQLRQGFLTGNEGERIGLAGSFVYEDGKTFTVKEITSLNIRVPHEIIGSADEIYERCLQNELRSILILSAPGRGKTTILRDLSRIICEKNKVNVLISDERNEIAAAHGDFSMNIGAFCDVIRYSYKRDALTSAVRAMRPDVIILDEIFGEEDVAAVLDCARSGVFVIASAHIREIDGLLKSDNLRRLVDEKAFERYVTLDFYQTGKVAAVYDRNLFCISRGEYA